MIKQDMKITNPRGLAVDLAGDFCDVALKYESTVRFYYRGDNEANGKSVLSILGAGIRCGETITVVCNGEDETEAMDALRHLMGDL